MQDRSFYSQASNHQGAIEFLLEEQNKILRSTKRWIIGLNLAWLLLVISFAIIVLRVLIAVLLSSHPL